MIGYGRKYCTKLKSTAYIQTRGPPFFELGAPILPQPYFNFGRNPGGSWWLLSLKTCTTLSTKLFRGQKSVERIKLWGIKCTLIKVNECSKQGLFSGYMQAGVVSFYFFYFLLKCLVEKRFKPLSERKQVFFRTNDLEIKIRCVSSMSKSIEQE